MSSAPFCMFAVLGWAFCHKSPTSNLQALYYVKVAVEHQKHCEKLAADQLEGSAGCAKMANLDSGHLVAGMPPGSSLLLLFGLESYCPLQVAWVGLPDSQSGIPRQLGARQL